MVTAEHAWKLVGPWYRWARAGMPADGRSSSPVFQKFAGSSFVNDFLAEPQHSLVFDPLIDVVSDFDQVSAKAGGLAGKIASLLPLDANGVPQLPGKISANDALRSRLAPSDLRKLFLPTHDRHYLVVCELHCDVPGFPSVPRREVCQAAFVIRRRRSVVPEGKQALVVTEVAAVKRAEADLGDLLTLVEEGERPMLDAAARSRLDARKAELASAANVANFDALLSARQQAVDDKRTQLKAWYAAQGIRTAVDGWFPRIVNGAESRSAGFWRELSDDEQVADPALGVLAQDSGRAGTLFETVHRLSPLVPDPRNAAHDATGRTLYYGVVPTGTSAHDDAGAPAFDAMTTLELRCFVRRHHECAPRRGKVPDCHGEVVWASPTEAYRVAAPFDAIGASQRPITIQMPDLRELAAQVARRPRGSLSPVRMVQEQHLSPVPTASTPKGSMGGPAICFFSIPLITIVALFVLNLFLPIVVFIFQLWFLLVLRFCIKPQISVGGQVDAALSAEPPGIDFDAAAGVKIGNTTYSALGLQGKLKAGLREQIKVELGELDSTTINNGLDALSNVPLAALAQSNDDNAKLPSDPSLPPPELSYSASLEYEPHRASEWRLQGGRG